MTEAERQAISDYVGFAVGILEMAAPSRAENEGHYANRALTYLHAIQKILDGPQIVTKAKA